MVAQRTSGIQSKRSGQQQTPRLARNRSGDTGHGHDTKLSPRIFVSDKEQSSDSRWQRHSNGLNLRWDAQKGSSP